MYPVTYKWGQSVAKSRQMGDMVRRLQTEIAKLPQYEPETKHHFHAGMYCREVYRDAGVVVVGKVHKKEHYYLIASGTVRITDGDGESVEVTGPHLIHSKPGTKRAVYSVTPAVCMTFHATTATTPEEAEAEMVEDDPDAMFDAQNRVKPGVLRHDMKEVLQ